MLEDASDSCVPSEVTTLRNQLDSAETIAIGGVSKSNPTKKSIANDNQIRLLDSITVKEMQGGVCESD